jgi:hypothetical protein
MGDSILKNPGPISIHVSGTNWISPGTNDSLETTNWAEEQKRRVPMKVTANVQVCHRLSGRDLQDTSPQDKSPGAPAKRQVRSACRRIRQGFGNS